ncbi:outer membrane protein [Kaistia terrae]|jgi:opacity protein-like surface antigen|uniref:Outer membrane protein n=1 Tax=Kaistia terrae TaxID=537017 RepID=A0ABW0PQB0_9HYPH|nr:outer membrane beta-barrel protein [Kaistia terrae]MCX5580174.1 outer membrane beta-barrel protein [Kaistia terrae]
MTKSRIVALAIAAGLGCGISAGAAVAADLPYVEPVPLATGGWYLRGAIGMSNQRLDNLEYQYFEAPGYATSWINEGDFSSAPTFSLGAGYKFNDWFRADLTGQYRAKANFNATQSVVDLRNPSVPVYYTDDYTARKSEWLFLANGYVDLGTYRGITPYLGAGIGTSRNTISGFRDVNPELGGSGYADSKSQWNFAWALHAGLGFQVTENLIFDLGYSFVDLGNAKTDTAYNSDPQWSRANDGFKFKNITSHDVNFGIRYQFN